MIGRYAARRWRALAIAALAGLLAVQPLQPAAAQATIKKPYDADLLRLAELLGAIHYLRALCGNDEGQVWRTFMTDLIDAEGFTAKRRLQLTQSFNKGYRSYQRTYRSCTSTAQTAIDRFLQEGGQLADTMAMFGIEPEGDETADAADNAQ